MRTFVKPYIGITGPVVPTESRVIAEEFENAGLNETRHNAMIGYLVSLRTLRGEPVANRRYPALSTLPYVIEAARTPFLERAGAIHMIHYNTRELDTLAEQVGEALSKAKGHCSAVQLNVPWPAPEQLQHIREQTSANIVFQANSKVLETSPSELTERLPAYTGLVDWVLLDPSGGAGKEFDMVEAVRQYRLFTNALPNAIIGFAGGFDGTNVKRRVHLLQELVGNNSFCIDAEGGLRIKVTGEYGDDLLSIDKTRAYLREANKVFEY